LHAHSLNTHAQQDFDAHRFIDALLTLATRGLDAPDDSDRAAKQATRS
jgi:hypothetical protein